MKRLATFLIVACMVMAVRAQAQHLKFMGIPLDGTISSFEPKLLAKGLKADTELNRLLSEGTRAYNGRFAGNDAFIAVYYDDKSKIVYRAKAVIKTSSSSQCDVLYEELKENLKEKYNVTVLFTNKQDGHESFSFFVRNESDPDSDEPLGTIGVYVTQEESYPFNKGVHVDYEDWTNSGSNKENKMDDL